MYVRTFVDRKFRVNDTPEYWFVVMCNILLRNNNMCLSFSITIIFPTFSSLIKGTSFYPHTLTAIFYLSLYLRVTFSFCFNQLSTAEDSMASCLCVCVCVCVVL